MRPLWWLILGLIAIPALGQNDSSQCSPLPDAPVVMLNPTDGAAMASASAPQQLTAAATSGQQPGGEQSSTTSTSAEHPDVDPRERQPKRILGMMPNYRAVSAGETPPPPSAKESFKLATVNSFDYSAIIFTGLTSLLAEGTNTHPDFGKGMPGFWAYSWRGFIDKTDGNYLVVFALPTVLHEDLRYYAMGNGGFKRRIFYAATSVLIARNYQGEKTFSGAEVFGRAIAQGASMLYYPDRDNTIGALFARYGYSVGRDAITATFREFWPDISTHVLHRNP